ncbi:hypothetical protein D3C86_1909870 [compost metagenome]
MLKPSTVSPMTFSAAFFSKGVSEIRCRANDMRVSESWVSSARESETRGNQVVAISLLRSFIILMPPSEATANTVTMRPTIRKRAIRVCDIFRCDMNNSEGTASVKACA